MSQVDGTLEAINDARTSDSKLVLPKLLPRDPPKQTFETIKIQTTLGPLLPETLNFIAEEHQKIEHSGLNTRLLPDSSSTHFSLYENLLPSELHAQKYPFHIRNSITLNNPKMFEKKHHIENIL
jgi:hypothetical protein